MRNLGLGIAVALLGCSSSSGTGNETGVGGTGPASATGGAAAVASTVSDQGGQVGSTTGGTWSDVTTTGGSTGSGGTSSSRSSVGGGTAGPSGGAVSTGGLVATGGKPTGGTNGTASTGAAQNPLGDCSSVINCSGVLCVDPKSSQCTSGSCLDDRRVSNVDFYCTKACANDPECPSGFVCLTMNIAGASTGSYCARYLAVCGNGIIDSGEVCDDNNTVGGDGCSANCKSNETCGNKVVDPGELCDDGNTSNGDGCSANCKSNESCGNHLIDLTEQCDDGNTVDGDGCASDCTVEKCGDGRPAEPEACDDANPGCDSECRIFPVNGISELSRYPNDSTFDWQSLMTGTGNNGQAFVSWIDPPSSAPQRIVLTTSDAGEHWQSRRTATVDVGSGLPLDQLLRGTSGNNLVLWYPSGDLTLRLRRSTDFGVTWGDLETVSMPTMLYIDHTDMMATEDNWYFLWANYSNAGTYSTYLTRSSDAGHTWAAPVLVVAGEPSCNDVKLAVGSDGHLFARTCMGAHYSDDDGATFHDATIDSTVDVRFLDAGHAINFGSGRWLAPMGYGYWETTDHFHTWTQTDLGPAWSGNLVTLMDSTGALWWGFGGQQDSAHVSRIVLRRSLDKGITWDPAITVATFTNLYTVPWGMASGTAGIYVWWARLEDGAGSSGAVLRYSHSSDGGANWSPTVSLSRTENYASDVNSFFIGADEAVHALWVERTKSSSTTQFFIRHQRLAP